MNEFFLLKLVSELLDDKPTPEKLYCAKKIIDEMILLSKPHASVQRLPMSFSNLDEEATAAKKDLLG